MATPSSVAVRAYVDGTYDDIPPSVRDDVASGIISLLTLVKELGDFLTSESDTVRARAVALLSGVVQHLAAQPNESVLTRQALRTLTQFFCDKLADAVAVGDARARARNDTAAPVPASAAREAVEAEEAASMHADAMLNDCLAALHALTGVGFRGDEQVAREAFGGEEARTLSSALFTLELRRYPQPLRYLLCRILDSLVARHRQALRAMRTAPDAPDGSAFIQGYTTLVQGEKDPRNLLVLFGLERVLLLEWPIGPSEAEALFHVLFCYFPISFRAPPDDPYGIAPDDLKRALRAAVSASPALAPLGLPVLLEKMSASGGAARIDTLRTLTACLPVYGGAAAHAHARELYGFLKLDILQPPDDETAACAQEALTALLRASYADAPLDALAHEMLDECLSEMREPGKSLARLSMHMVASFVRASPSTAHTATQRMLAQLLGAQLPQTDDAEMPALLGLLADLLTEVGQHPANAPDLATAHDTLLAAFTSEAALRCEAGVRGLVSLTKLPALLSPDEVAYAARGVQAALLAPDSALQAPALAGLEAMLATHAPILEGETLPLLLQELPTHLDAPSRTVRTVLGALARLCTPPTLFAALSTRVMQLLQNLATQSDHAITAGYACALLATLHVALEHKIEAKHDDLASQAAQLSPRLLAWLATSSPLVQVSDVLLVLAPLATPADAQALLNEAVQRYDGPSGARSPLTNAPTAAPSVLLAPWAALFCALPSTVEVPGGGDAWLDALLSFLTTQAGAEGAPDLAARSAGLLVCALANKVCAPRAEALATFWARLPLIPSPARQRACLEAWVYMARGWLARGEAQGLDMLTTLRTAMLTDARLGTKAASALHVLVHDDALFSRAHGFRVRLLYKQRLLDTFVPQLLEAYHTATNEAARTVCLVALATLLPALSSGTLQARFPTLLPLLVHTLHLDDGHARASAARALYAVLMADTSEEALRLPIHALLSHLLASVTPGAAAPPATRLACLHLLSALVDKMPKDELAPYQRRVVQTLGRPAQGVDDPRRAVRAAAVDCRDVWFRL
ncbi:hypothetical protein MEQU1_001995 [Malassezia equina]|uniref:MMS19 nucleotide excision repair protein n=1 Tax=Malassezia equina TaxID=1381935 RepID=A0AAF0EEX9_9BASI|nr:hypothetical protein MEQU1_001995 [Malassezia equina]